VISNPSPRLITALRTLLRSSNSQQRVTRFFWSHLEADTLSRVCLGMMIDLNIIAANDPLAVATINVLDGTYNEKLRFRSLDIEHSRQKFNNSRVGVVRIWPDRSYQGHLPPRTLSDEYALTHTIFYLTDFGKRLRVTVPHQTELVERLEFLCAEALFDNNLDILAEHLLALRYLDVKQFDFHWYANQICDRIDSNCYWKGPLSLKAQLKNEGFQSRQFEFLENYHTTLLIRDFLLGFDGGRAGDVRPNQVGPNIVPLVKRISQRKSPFSNIEPRRDVALLKNLLIGNKFRASGVVKELKHPGGIQLYLMACFTNMRLRKIDDFQNESKLVDVLLPLANMKLQWQNKNFLFTQFLARSLNGVYADKLEAEVLLAKVERSYQRCSREIHFDEGDKRTSINSSIQQICAATLIFVDHEMPLSKSLETAIRGALHHSMRNHDVFNISYLLWAYDLTRIVIDRHTSKVLYALVRASIETIQYKTSLDIETRRALALGAEMCSVLLERVSRGQKKLRMGNSEQSA